MGTEDDHLELRRVIAEIDKVTQCWNSLAEPDPYAGGEGLVNCYTRGGEGLVNCYTSTRTTGMHLHHRATHIRDVTIGLIVLLVLVH